MTTGLTLGKYAPFHKGHQHVIETALDEVDDLIILVYDSPDVTNVPVTIRAQWIRDIYPSTDVRIAWTGPRDTGYTDELKRRHQEYVISLLDDGESIDAFYSSEPYGEHMSDALDADDRRVDPDRETVPISGTEIRQNTYENREFVDPRVYRDLITNVAFLGGPSTGKTTLARSLANEFETEWMPEYGQEYWEENAVDGELTRGQLVELAEEHRKRENTHLERANQYLFTDTNAITTYAFCRDYHGTAPNTLKALAFDCAHRYDLLFVCDTDIPFDNSNGRRGERARERLQRRTLNFLHEHNIPYHSLSGDLDARIETVRDVLDDFEPYWTERTP